MTAGSCILDASLTICVELKAQLVPRYKIHLPVDSIVVLESCFSCVAWGLVVGWAGSCGSAFTEGGIPERHKRFGYNPRIYSILI